MKNERRPGLQFGAAMDNSAAGLKSTSRISGNSDTIRPENGSTELVGTGGRAADDLGDAQSNAFNGILYPHQRLGLVFLLSQERAVLADDVGLGKTVQVAALIGLLADSEDFRQPGRLPVLYITSVGLVQQTGDELRQFLPGLSVTTVLGPRRRTTTDPLETDLHVVNHDYVHRNQMSLQRLRPSLVVVDEASALKAAGVKHRSIKELCRTADRAVALTATPFENDPLDLWAILSLLGFPGLWSRRQFIDSFCREDIYPDGRRKVTGWKSRLHADQVMRWIGRRFLRRTSREVGVTLPTKEETRPVLVPLSRAQELDYRRAASIRHDLKRHRRQRDVSRRGSDGTSPLFNAAVAAAIREAHLGRKVVIYTEHLADLDDIAEQLTAANVGRVCLRGESNKDQRADAVKRFRDDPNVHVLAGTKVLENGLNLQFAQTLISAGVSYNPARELQREGRLCRIGSPNETYRHLVFLPDTQQTRRQLQVLDHKNGQAAPVLGSRRSGQP
jgi:SNF2 family DNA or RNA helicase